MWEGVEEWRRVGEWKLHGALEWKRYEEKKRAFETRPTRVKA